MPPLPEPTSWHAFKHGDCRRVPNTRQGRDNTSQIEWCNGAIFHAAPSKLNCLDSVQRSVLRHLGIDEKRAYIEFNIAPLKLRRDIGILGALFEYAEEPPTLI